MRLAVSLMLIAFGAESAAAHAPDAVDSTRPVLVVTAAAPLDAERLADALRAYLDDFAIDVRTAPAAPPGDLRAELAATAEIGANARAWAVVRLDDQTPGNAEIELVDRETAKSLVTIVPRPRRDEDLYRAVALKVQALLRATLAEPTDTPPTRPPALARLAAATASSPAWGRHRIALETAFAWTALPSQSLAQKGVDVSASHRLGGHLEVALGAEALSALRAQRGATSAVVNRVPIDVSLRLCASGAHWDGEAGLIAEVSVVSIETSSPTLAVRSGWAGVPAVGGQLGGRLRLSDPAWLFVRTSALGVLADIHYTAQGQPLLALTGAEVEIEAGVGLAFW
jgi:hypothetical protein